MTSNDRSKEDTVGTNPDSKPSGNLDCPSLQETWSCIKRFAKRMAPLLPILLLGYVALVAYTDWNLDKGAAHRYVPNASDRARATAIGHFIGERYGKFAPEADRTHVGKIYYVRPSRDPQILIYEVVDPVEIARIEAIARQGLDAKGIPRVELIFYEKQNWHSTDGGGSRGPENVIKRIMITRQTF